MNFFISYTQADSKWAQWIAWQLQAADYSVHIEAWDFRAGGNWVDQMQKGVAEAERIILVVSPRYFASAFTRAEWMAAFAKDPDGSKGMLVPVRIAKCELPALLRPVVYIELVDREEQSAREALLEGIRKGGGPPSTPPPFPTKLSQRPPELPPKVQVAHNLPFRPNLIFRGRDKELNKVRDILQKKGAAAVTQAAAIIGLGGVGKTQLAIEYAWDALRAGTYDWLLWVRAENAQSLDDSLAALATVLGLPAADAREAAGQREAVLSWLKTSDRPWLLIADNVDTAEAADAVRQTLPFTARGHILITARFDQWRYIEKVPLDSLQREEAASLLCERVEREAPGHDPGGMVAAGELADELGALPLALEQAAAYVAELRWKFFQYREAFRRERPALMNKHGIDPERYDESVATTWLITLGQVRPLPRTILRLAAWFAPEEIPRGLFTSSPEVLRRLGTLDQGEATGADEALGELARFSLIKLSADSVSVHRLLQDVQRDLTPASDAQQWIDGAAALVSAWAPFASNDAALWGDWGRVRPHVEMLLDRASRNGVETNSVAYLCDRFATFLQARAEYGLARPLFENAVRIDQKNYGLEHETVALRLFNFGELLREMGEFPAAEHYFRRAVDITEKRLGPNHGDVAIRLNNLAMLLHQTQRSSEAEGLLQRALAIDEASGARLGVASRLDILSRVLVDTGRASEAEPLIRRALAVKVSERGPDHLEIADSLHNLSRLFRDTGRYAEAEPLARQALKIVETELPATHPRVGVFLNRLAKLLQMTDRSADAEALAVRALSIFEKALPAEHRYIDRARKTIASIRESLKVAASTPAELDFVVNYFNPKEQLVDFDSRFGVWWDQPSRGFGIDHGAICSQREGKHFMDPLARLGVIDIKTGNDLFATGGPDSSFRGYPWGAVQSEARDDVRLEVTVVYAAVDVIVAKIALTNTGTAPRRLRLTLGASTVDGEAERREYHARLGRGESADSSDVNGAIKMPIFHAPLAEGTRSVIMLQTSAPTSIFCIRDEPKIEILTAWRTDFAEDFEKSDYGKFSARSGALVLESEVSKVFTLAISTASMELRGSQSRSEELSELLQERLRGQQTPADKLIADAQQRWRRIFQRLPAEKLRGIWARRRPGNEPQTLQPIGEPPPDLISPDMVHRAMMILLQNTVRAQSEQGYGSMMGNYRGTFPCRFSYEAFWAWDCAFQALGCVEWDIELAKENVLLMLRHQDPEKGWLPMLHPDAFIPSAQPPLFAWVAREIYNQQERTNVEAARAFLKEVYPKLERWNRWWFRYRDKNGNGLAEWGNNLESGWDDSPRWDNIDGTAGWNNDEGSAPWEAVDLNSYLIKDMRCLSWMAEKLGDHDAARRWDAEASKLAKLVVEVLYDPEDNLFYDTHYATGERRKLLTPACFLPLWAGVPLPEESVREMIETYLLSPDYFFGEQPFPTVAYSEREHDAAGKSGYWRGPVWLNIAYFMIEVLEWHGFHDQARDAAARILSMVEKGHIHENYNAQTGKRGDHSQMDFSWSAAMVIAIACWDLTRSRPPLHRGDLQKPLLHLSFCVRDRSIYGRSKEAWLQISNRAEEPVSGTLRFRLPEKWEVRAQNGSVSPAAHAWPGGAHAFHLSPHAREEVAVCFSIPPGANADEVEIAAEACPGTDSTAPVGRCGLRLERCKAPTPAWLTHEAAEALAWLCREGDPFRYRKNGEEIKQSGPGLVGMLDSRREFLGRHILAVHIGERDFIKHAIWLLTGVTALNAMREQLERLLGDTQLSPQQADEQAVQYIELAIQQARDYITV